MKTLKNRGFVLILVITAIATIGIEMFVLAGVANTMQFQSHRAYLEACRRNLMASGLAWARQNVSKKAGEVVPQTIELDVSRMNVRGAGLELTVSPPSERKAEILIKTSCSRGRQTLRGENKYEVAL